MEPTVLKGLGPARRDKLSEAGIDSVEALAGADPDALADEVDVPRKTLERFVRQAGDLLALGELEGVGEAHLEALAEAGIRSRKELGAGPAEDVAAAAGLEADRVREWQEALGTFEAEEVSREAAEGLEPGKPGVVESAERMQEGALEATDELAERLGEARVVLEEGISDARVKFEDEVLAEARILPVKAREDAEELLEDIQGNVVVLREAADDALVRVEGRISEGLPVFKQQLDEAADQAEEVRVRVEGIRDKGLAGRAEDLKAKVKGLLGLD